MTKFLPEIVLVAGNILIGLWERYTSLLLFFFRRTSIVNNGDRK